MVRTERAAMQKARSKAKSYSRARCNDRSRHAEQTGRGDSNGSSKTVTLTPVPVQALGCSLQDALRDVLLASRKRPHDFLRELDADGSGAVSRDEFGLCLCQYGLGPPTVPEEAIDALFAQIDTDASGWASAGELFTALRRELEPPAELLSSHHTPQVSLPCARGRMRTVLVFHDGVVCLLPTLNRGCASHCAPRFRSYHRSSSWTRLLLGLCRWAADIVGCSGTTRRSWCVSPTKTPPLRLACLTDGWHRCGLPLQRPAFTSGTAAQRSAAIDLGRLRAQLRGTRTRALVTRSPLSAVFSAIISFAIYLFLAASPA